jgi:hypothetical protein
MIFVSFPCDNRTDNGFLIFNELMASSYLYVLISITDYNESGELYDRLSFVLMGIFIFTFLINLLNFFCIFFASLFNFAKSKWNKHCRSPKEGGSSEEKYKNDIEVKFKARDLADKTQRISADTFDISKH